MNDPIDVSQQRPIEDLGANMLVRAPGCFLAFIAFVLLITIPDLVSFKLPSAILAVAAALLGLGLVATYVRLVRRRWNVAAPDVVQILSRDLNAIRRRRLSDYRLKFPTGTPWQERALHEGVYSVKWLGYLLLVAGLGWLLYQLFVALGIVAH